jgi:DNA-binding MurR/RpiR family transcriptional regulator
MSIHKGFKKFGEAIATIVNSVLLSIVYIIGVGATAITAKFVKKKFLKLNKNSQSYWEDLNLTKEPIENYYRGF